MQATRQHILDFLESQRSASAHEMGQAFGMTPANLRHHLKILEKRDLVKPIGHRTLKGRGRPEQLYALSVAAQDENSQGLAKALLTLIAEPQLPKRNTTRLKQLAAQLAGKVSLSAGHITQRLVAAVKRLNGLGYRPRWEARPGGTQFVLGQCPYAGLIAEHPELCTMDAFLLERLIGHKVAQKTKLAPGPESLPQCVFAIQHSPSERV
ncbi:MAG: ArsR family transcriptional regulator [Chloroflexi bacterium]|nr:ArsR family transcriptional regulator [Chloroflexota bacterium]MQC26863.1 ArsR family transcriptional regulator [Chloroflexota bacterium]